MKKLLILKTLFFKLEMSGKMILPAFSTVYKT